MSRQSIDLIKWYLNLYGIPPVYTLKMNFIHVVIINCKRKRVICMIASEISTAPSPICRPIRRTLPRTSLDYQL